MVAACRAPDLKARRGMAAVSLTWLKRLRGADLATALQPAAPDVDCPPESDWAWRPDAWRLPQSPPGLVGGTSGQRLGQGLAVFHDCPRGEIALRQIANAAGPAPKALQLEVFGFGGSYLSLAVDLPGDVARSLRRHHILRTEIVLESERPAAVFARLNLRHGPNLAQIVREVPQDGVAEFDLAFERLNEARITAAWLDVILEDPAMNRIVLRDLTFSRRRRAEL